MLARFPNTHIVIASALAVAFVVTLAVQFGGSEREPERYTVELALHEVRPAATVPAASDPDAAQDATEQAATAASAAEPAVPLTSRVERVKPGENLAVIFKRMGLSPRVLHDIVNSGPLGSRLKNIYPGHRLTFETDPEGALIRFAYTPGPLETLEFERAGDRFIARQNVREPEPVTTHRHAVIDHSLFVASQRIGLNDDITIRLAQIFQWDIDFVLDVRKGDEFYVLYQELYLGDEFIGYGDILAAEFVNQGERHQAVRYVNQEGRGDFYTPTGESMRKAFLRAPVEFSRISSNFNLRRVHPLFNRSMPHRGIDYVAPVGTPVLASGDGKVVTASRTKANGNYVVLQHGEQFQTKYLHLSKFGRGIKRGQRVSQGRIIGYVGATGWATGAHLHYEFLVNGVHKNPRTVKLPKAQPIPSHERPRFDDHTQPLLVQLETYKQQRQLALLSP